MLDRYAPRLKLWRGEAGFPSENPKGGNGALCHLAPTEEQQACWIARNVVNDLAMKELDFYSYFHLYDFLHFSRKYPDSDVPDPFMGTREAYQQCFLTMKEAIENLKNSLIENKQPTKG